MLLRRPSFYVALAGIAGMVLIVRKSQDKPPAPPPFVEPARSPYSNSVAATGIIEATRENVKVATPKSGLIQKLYIQVGSTVKSGDPVLQLDDREARARLATAQAQLGSLRASLKVEKVMAADAEDQFNRTAKLEKQNVASEDESKRKEFAWQNWQARVAKIEADLRAAEAQVRQARTELDVLTVRAPRDGAILQVNVREGEFAGTTPTEPLLVLGDVDKLQVRADVDEQNAPLVQPDQPAVAFLKGTTQNPIPLRFVRIEPFVVPKKSLTGDSTERVDTRVLQIIFELNRPAFPLYVGQQVDVFIQRSGDAKSASHEAGPMDSATRVAETK
jgi:RND family efflux transporter MFP subunit